MANVAINVSFPEDLMELPAVWNLTPKDVGFTHPLDHVTKFYDTDADLRKQADAFLELFLDMMGARAQHPTPNSRPKLDTKGKVALKPKQMQDDFGNDLVVYMPVHEERSPWGVGPEDCRAGDGNPAPAPGHWATKVRQHWTLLLPQLRWMNTQPIVRKNNPITEEHIKNRMDPKKNRLRAKSLEFVESRRTKDGFAKSTWDGQK